MVNERDFWTAPNSMQQVGLVEAPAGFLLKLFENSD